MESYRPWSAPAPLRPTDLATSKHQNTGSFAWDSFQLVQCSDLFVPCYCLFAISGEPAGATMDFLH